MQLRKSLLLVFLLSTVALSGYAQIDPVDKKTKVAIGGYDLVSYFKTGKPQKGSTDFSYTLNGAIYYFTNEANKKAFAEAPEKYLPQYDGYCALAVAQNRKVSINPESFKITNDKLYLFFNGPLPFNRELYNSLDSWVKDEPNLIKKADNNWPTTKKKKF
jgi:YHS domain-containing protein